MGIGISQKAPPLKRLKSAKNINVQNYDLVTEKPKQRNKHQLQKENVKPNKPKCGVSKKRQQEKDAALSQPKRIRERPVKPAKYCSSLMDIKDTLSQTTNCAGELEVAKTNPETEPEIRLTKFVPTQIFLKKDLTKKCMHAVNHTVTTVTPTGKVVSNIKICSIMSDSEGNKSSL